MKLKDINPIKHSFFSSKLNFLNLALICTIVFSCEFSNEIPGTLSPLERDTTVSGYICKWFDGHTAALSITNDDGNPCTALQNEIQNYAHQSNCIIDYEMVTENFINNPDLIESALLLFNEGKVSFFGHGHQHLNHDALEYNDSYNSFTKCFEIMDSLGFIPVAYAYPGGYGYKYSTRRALDDAGFLCGRKYEQLDFLDPYIVPGETLTPLDWFALPSLIMQSYDYDACEVCINNTAELIPFLDNTLEKSAWLILTYHAIGSNNAYGFFELEEFEKNIDAIAERDIWCAPMREICLYTREREKAVLNVTWKRDKFGKMSQVNFNLNDNLPDNIYTQPLTVEIPLPDEWIGLSLKLLKKDIYSDTLFIESKELQLNLLPDDTEYFLILE